MNARMSSQPFTLRNVFNCEAVSPASVSFGEYLDLYHVLGGSLIDPEMRLFIERTGDRLHLKGTTKAGRALSAELDPQTLEAGGLVYWWSGAFTSKKEKEPDRSGKLYLIVRKLDPENKEGIRIARIEVFEDGSGHVPPSAACVTRNQHRGSSPGTRKGPKPPPAQPCPPPAAMVGDQDEEGEGYDSYEP